MNKSIIDYLNICLAAPLCSPLPPPRKPPPEREVHPEGTCEDCGAEENADGSPLTAAYGWVETPLRCRECHSMHQPGGY